MKKTHWLRTTLITLAACGLAGIILAVILFNANPGRTGATSSVEFSFDGAADGIAPNSLRYDVSGFTSEEVLSAALAETGLADKYTVEQLQENILVSGVYPEDIVSQMTGYESLLTGDTGKVSAADYHATLYNVALYNDFDKSIPRADLEKLLESIMAHFRARFEKTYSVFLSRDNLADSISGYDYPQQLELLEDAAARYETFAVQMSEDHPDFLENGEGFADIAAKYNNLRTSDLQRLSGQVTMNALSVDQDRIASQYENQIKVLEISLNELAQEAEDIKALIGKYTRDDIIYVSTTAALQEISGNSATYDTLVAAQKKVEDQIAEKNKELVQTRLKLADIRGEETAVTETSETADGENEVSTEPIVISEEERAAQKAAVEKGITAAVRKLNQYTDTFSAFLKTYSEREMNDSTVAVTNVRFSTPKLLSGAFAKQVIKTAGPICVLGLIVCLLCMIVSRWKEEKRKA